MLDFITKIKELYKVLFQPIDYEYKILAVNKYKKIFNIDESSSFGEYYSIVSQDSKEKGKVYTPIEISNYIIQNTIKDEDIIKNPFIKIVDPSCGCGNILIPCFNYLKTIFQTNIDKINSLHNLNLNKSNISKHILDNNLYGFDIDSLAIIILRIDLFCKSGFINSKNFNNKDFLTDNISEKFDVFLGNPPYVGHKTINKYYGSKIKKLFPQIYKDKGDLSYCFFQKSLINLNKKGKLTFITSRYFLESSSGEELRKTLKECYSINKIIDFYGIRPFKNIGIDPVIIFISNNQIQYEEIEVIKPLYIKGKNSKCFYNSLFLDKTTKDYSYFKLNKIYLNNSGWILRNKEERNIINKIERKSFNSLVNICNSYQGIITGCDKAFVVDKEIIYNEDLEVELLRPWIKSSFIRKDLVKQNENFLIYSDLIDEESKYPNSIKHISEFKDKLLKRRECERGFRKWYQLQWGRDKSIFENEKIIFPYKSNSNKFVLDKGSYFSADIYALTLKDNVPFTYEYIVFLLNSKIYEFYFKTFAKKLGYDLYEYYPNNLMKLCIPLMMDESKCNEESLYEFFEFTDREIEIIKSI